MKLRRGTGPTIATLLAIRGPLTGMRRELDDATRFGRDAASDLALPDAAVSREHARIVRNNLAWSIEDLGSQNGTFVNRQRVEGKRTLLRNDEIQIGASLFLFDSEFDLQNADFSDKSVFFAAPSDETMELSPVAVIEAPEAEEAKIAADGSALDFVVRVGELFDGTLKVNFAESLRGVAQRVAKLFGSEQGLLMLWDSAAGELRTSVALSPGESLLADRSIIDRVFREKKALMISDRNSAPMHPAPGAPSPSPFRSVMCAPLDTGDAVLGVLYLERQEINAYSLVDLRNFRAVTKLLAVFIEGRQKAEAAVLRAQFAARDSEVRGSSPQIKGVLDLVMKMAPTKATVLVLGETGTGKELIAREVHRLSNRANTGAPFVAVNCSAIPESLVESMLFGHEKGSFTGAIKTQRGLIEQANGGTLFLDEIGEMSITVQPKLLRFLQERVFTRVGGSHPIRADVRLVCATNRDLEQEVKAGKFRDDLFHRISVLPITIPPLRERRTDIRVLAEHFAKYHADEMGKEIIGISDEAMIALEKYDWPGNVRELSNCIERGVLLCDGKVLLPRHFQLGNRRPENASLMGSSATAAETRLQPASFPPLAEIEKIHILKVLAACDENQVAASDVLGIHRNTLRKKLQEYGVL